MVWPPKPPVRFVNEGRAADDATRYLVAVMDTHFDDPRRIPRRAPRFSLQLWVRATGWRGRAILVLAALALLVIGVWAAGSAQPLSSFIEFRGASSIVIAQESNSFIAVAAT